MICPHCLSKNTRVVDKRDSNQQSIRRRRECLNCKKRFTTYERIETEDIYVIKKDGRREKFNPAKLRAGILKACEKRPISQEKIDRIVNEIENEIRNSAKKDEINSKKIGDFVIEKLKSTDKVAYIRFASVYREFKDVSSFEKELKNLKKWR